MTTTRNQPTADTEIFGPYEVYERLGLGGMATVHRARERGIEGFERIVALKRLLPHLAEDASFVRSFVREAKLASMLQHANIVQLYELGRVGQVLFISMELIEGRDVRKLLRQARRVAGPPPMSVFISLMCQVCDALDYAHTRTDEHGEPLGLVHRDVSPSNLLVSHSGHVKVIDFGIAKAQSSHLRTQTGRVKGKVAYMAPESVRHQELDARSDIFSAGVIAHELLTARPLFATRNEYETLVRAQRCEVDPPSAINPNCSPDVDALVLKALARNPDERWSSAAEMRDALEDVRSMLGVSATNREVAAWMEWAFALETPPTGVGTRPGTDSHSSTLSFHSRSRSDIATPLPRSIGGVGRMMRSSATPLPIGRDYTPGLNDGDTDVYRDAADLAWGALEEEHGNIAPEVLDDIPDVSAKGPPRARRSTGLPIKAPAGMQTPQDAVPDSEMPPQMALRGAAGAASTSASGAGQNLAPSRFAVAAEPDRAGRGWHGKLAAVVALVAVAAGGLYAYRVSTERTGPVAPTAVTTALLKFAVEPGDANIEVAGNDPHRGSPFQLEVDAPGIYQLAIHRDGFKSYVSEIQVDAGENYNIRVALQPGGSAKASVVIRSTPSGQEVLIDGVVHASRTPATLDIAPGKHVIAIRDSNGSSWEHIIEAKANTHYEFHPDLRASADRAGRRTVDRGTRNDRDRDRDRDRRRREQRVDVPEVDVEIPTTVDDEAAIASGAQQSGPSPSASPSTSLVAGLNYETLSNDDGLRGLKTVQPPKVEAPKPPPRKGPVRIDYRQARRISGSIPKISSYNSPMPRRIATELCIDTRGKVTKVVPPTKIHPRSRNDLRKALTKWRYAPYKEDGRAVAACFAVPFNTRR